MAIRLLLDDVRERRDFRSLAVLFTLGLGIDFKAAGLSSDDQRLLDTAEPVATTGGSTG